MTNTISSTEITERLKFYADTPEGERNKYFCWKISSIATLKDALWGFLDRGWNIRAAWYEKIDCSTGEVLVNTKLNIIAEIDERLQARKKKFPSPKGK